MNSEEISSIIQTSETAIAKEYANSIINDVHLISIGGRLSNPTLCWMIPSGFKDLSFSEEIGIKSGKYWLPTTIFKLYSQEETLEVVVADETIWIDAFNMSLHKYKNPLYRCPYLNMQNDTVNCMGDAVPLTEGFSIAQIMNAWTNNFFAAKFNSISRNLKIKTDQFYAESKSKIEFNQEWFIEIKQSTQDFFTT